MLAAAKHDDDITWWQNDDTPRDGGWDERPVRSDFDGAWSVYAADVDGDGDMDILGAARYDSDIMWWENQGTGQGE